MFISKSRYLRGGANAKHRAGRLILPLLALTWATRICIFTRNMFFGAIVDV